MLSTQGPNCEQQKLLWPVTKPSQASYPQQASESAVQRRLSAARQCQVSHSKCHHDDVATREVWGSATPSLFPRPGAVWFSSVWATERVLPGTQIQLGWRCPVGGAWVAQGPTIRVLFFWHPSAGFLLAQVLWTAGGLFWIVSRYFLHCLSKPHCSTTFPVIVYLKTPGYVLHDRRIEAWFPAGARNPSSPQRPDRYCPLLVFSSCRTRALRTQSWPSACTRNETNNAQSPIHVNNKAL